MSNIKSGWEQLVHSETVDEEILAINRLRKISQKDNLSFSLYMIDFSGKKIHYNDFKNQKIVNVAIDFYPDDAQFTLGNWKPLDIDNVSLFFLE